MATQRYQLASTIKVAPAMGTSLKMIATVMILSIGCVGHVTADDGDGKRPEAREGDNPTRNALRDGAPRDGDYRDGQRFRSMRDRIQQARADGDSSERRPDGRSGRFGRPGGGQQGDRQGGPMAIPMFRALDRNRDGRIDADELDLAVASLRTLDRNNDGELEMQELFQAGAGAMGRPGAGQGRAEDGMRRPGDDRPEMGGRPMPSVEQMFSQFDRNGDGAIDQEEAPGRIRENFDRVDQDGDGKLTQEELQIVRQRMSQMGQRGGRGRSQSNDPAGGTRPRRPETEE